MKIHDSAVIYLAQGLNSSKSHYHIVEPFYRTFSVTIFEGKESVNTVEPLLSGPLLNGHPLLEGL